MNERWTRRTALHSRCKQREDDAFRCSIGDWACNEVMPNQWGSGIVREETIKCTTLEFDVGCPSTLAATNTTSSPTPCAVPSGAVKSTQTVPDSPAPSANSFGSTLPT